MSDTVHAEIVSQIIGRELTEMTSTDVESILYNQGFSSRKSLVDALTSEFIAASRDEGYQPYLLKSSLRSEYIFGKMPEFFRNAVVENIISYIPEDRRNNQNDFDAEAAELTSQKLPPFTGSGKSLSPQEILSQLMTTNSPSKKKMILKELPLLEEAKIKEKEKEDMTTYYGLPPGYPPAAMTNPTKELEENLRKLANGNAIEHTGISASSNEDNDALYQTLLESGVDPNLLRQALTGANQFIAEQPASSPMTDLFKSVGTTVGQEIKGAVTAEVSARINRHLVRMARQAIPSLPAGPVWDGVLGFAIPAVLLIAAHSFRGMGDAQKTMGISNQLVDGVEATAKAALGGVSRDTVRQVTDFAVPMLGAVAAMGNGYMPPELDEGE